MFCTSPTRYSECIARFWVSADNSTITRPLTITLEDSVLDLHGFLTFTNTIEYWIENRIIFPFQNQSLAFVINGNNFLLDGNDVGGIDGNGQMWYDYSRDEGNKFGRPMSLAISDAKNVEIKRWTVKQPQFWAIVTIRAENVVMKDIYINATSFNPEVGCFVLGTPTATNGSLGHIGLGCRTRTVSTLTSRGTSLLVGVS